MTRDSKLRLFVAVLLVGAVWGASASADEILLSQILVDDVVLADRETTERLRVLRAGAFEATDAAPGITLAVGDSLLVPAVDDEGVQARLRCSDEADVRVAEAFEAVVLPADGELACNLLVLRGAAHVQTDAPTRLQSGEVVMGSRSTQYGARVHSTRRGTVEEVLVFEGEVVVRTSGEQAARTVGAGQKLVVAPRAGSNAGSSTASTVRTMDIDTDDVKRAATVYARLDSATAAKADTRGFTRVDANTASRLEALYARSFLRPDDPSIRLQLATAQLDADLPTWTSLYQLDRAVQGFESRGDQSGLALSLVKRASVYEARGDENAAQRQLERALTVDPEVIRELSSSQRLAISTSPVDGRYDAE